MKAEEFLTNASDTIAQRGKQYDKPAGERSMAKTVAAFNAITGRDITESEGWLFMQVLKDVRQWQKPDYHHDSAVDCVSYSALKAESLFNSKKEPDLFADTPPTDNRPKQKSLDQQICEWHEDTFPNATDQAIERKFHEELQEFEKEYYAWRLSAPNSIFEFADMYIVYAAYLKRVHNESLAQYIENKLNVNKGRIWGEEDENGDRPRCK